MANHPQPTFYGGFNPGNPQQQQPQLAPGGFNPSQAYGGINYGGTNSQPGFQPSLLQRITGFTNPDDGSETQGFGGLALNTFSGLASTYLGMKQFGLAKDALKQNKRQFNLNFNAQAKLTNAQLEGKQRAQVAANPNAESVESYLKKYAIGPGPGG